MPKQEFTLSKELQQIRDTLRVAKLNSELTSDELAEEAMINISTLYKYMNGTNQIPLNALLQLLRALDLNLTITSNETGDVFYSLKR